MPSAKTQVQINMRTRATGKNVSNNGEGDDDVRVVSSALLTLDSK